MKGDGPERCRKGHVLRQGSFRVYRFWRRTEGRWVVVRLCLRCKRKREKKFRDSLRRRGICVDCCKRAVTDFETYCNECVAKHKRYYVYGTMRAA